MTFLYNGGPGSATMWLHMGAFGPRRIVTPTDAHTPAAPYRGQQRLEPADATDLVFIDAPGTGFSRIAGKDKEKAFFGVDPDAYAFAEFIRQFLSKYGRWNSPKYLFGESYGTPRSAVVGQPARGRSLDRSERRDPAVADLNFDLSPDPPDRQPGRRPAVPDRAADLCGHGLVPPEAARRAPNLETFLTEVEQFAMGDYARALPPAPTSARRRHAIAEKLHEYTGLPVEYILKADLRIDGGEFRQTLQGIERPDHRPPRYPLLRARTSTPESARRLRSAVRGARLRLRRRRSTSTRARSCTTVTDKTFKPSIGTFRTWNFPHQLPGQRSAATVAPGQQRHAGPRQRHEANPNLKVQLNAGYFDLATPFYQGVYEMQHLPIPQKLLSNIEYPLLRARATWCMPRTPR